MVHGRSKMIVDNRFTFTDLCQNSLFRISLRKHKHSR